jgi:hypothetical protein
METWSGQQNMPFFTNHRCLVVVVVDEAAAAVDQVGPASSGRQPGGPRLFLREMLPVPYHRIGRQDDFVSIGYFSFILPPKSGRENTASDI